jgi:hypothetical protein
MRLGQAILATVLFVTACGGTETTAAPFVAPTSLAAARTQWNTLAPARYVMIERRICECLATVSRSVRVVVSRATTDTIVSATDAETGAAVTAGGPAVLSVDGLFRLLTDALARRAARVDVEYDPVLGFPRRVFIDFDAAIADDEITYEVSSVVSSS